MRHKWLLGLPAVPFFIVLVLGVTDRLGPDPGQVLVHETGRWAMNWLLATLTITPLVRYTSWYCLPWRRVLGLYAFAYGVIHLLCYSIFYLGFDPGLLGRELVKRPYIAVGSLALLLLVPLAITSTRQWQRRLGRRWKSLHGLVYVIMPMVILHFAWQIKAGWLEPLVYALVFLLLMLLRRLRFSV